MSIRRALPWMLAFAALAAFGSGLVQLPGSPGRLDAGPGQTLDGTVTRVIDGDTVEVRAGDRTDTVRYIGIDTPETKRPDTPVQCFGPAASAANRRLVAGQAVRLRVGTEARDRYGRLLAYVYRRRDSLFVNAELVRRGFARTLPIPPNTDQAPELAGLAQQARRDRRGLWSSCATADVMYPQGVV